MTEHTCHHCDEKYEREPTGDTGRPAIYCSPRCRRRAKNKRWLRNKNGRLKHELCEEPGATIFRTTPKSRRAAERMALRYNKKVWECPCGGLHLKRMPVKEMR